MKIHYAYYKHKKGKVYLKRNGWKKFQEVELKMFYYKGQSYLKVVPVNNQIKLC